MAILIGATDTSPTVLTQGLYWLKWCLAKAWILEQEINKVVPDGFDLSKLTTEMVEEIDYLSFYAKELLRVDCPAILNFFQVCQENVQIDGIEFLKDTLVIYNIGGLHYSKNQWITPEEFIPERFDPLSKFYLKPNGELWSKFAFLPFTFGPWACPGQFLALLQIKIYLIFLVKSKAWDWDIIDPDVWDAKLATFLPISSFKLKSQ